MMKSLQRIFLALVLGGSLHAAPLSVSFLSSDPTTEFFAVDGPLGREIHSFECCSEPSVRTILQNDRWQILIRMEHDLNSPRWWLINYGQGPGEYDKNAHIRFDPYFSPLDVPGYTLPPGLCCPNLAGTPHTEFAILDNSSNATGEAVYDAIEFTAAPGGDLVTLTDYRVPFTLNVGDNPFFVVPEPGSVLLTGIGIVAWGVLRRRPQTVRMVEPVSDAVLQEVPK